MADTSKRRYRANARSTEVIGRMLCTCRDIHFVADGPVENGLPGEAITPGELFLSGVAACAVELVQVFAKSEELPLGSIEVEIEGKIDLENQARPGVTLFNQIDLRFLISGVSEDDATRLVERFKGR